MREVEEYYQLKDYKVKSGSSIIASSEVEIEVNGELKTASAEGDGPVDASFKAIDKITGKSTTLVDYAIEAVSE